MNIDRIVMTVASLMILVSIALTQYVDPNWFWLTAFVGVNMLIAGLTKFCLMAIILKKIGAKPGSAFN